MKPSFAVMALLVCFLGVLVTTISSHGPFELASDKQEDESKLRVSEEAVEGDGIDQEDEEEESEDVDDENEVDNSERYFLYYFTSHSLHYRPYSCAKLNYSFP